MPLKTAYLIQCRCGDFVPLLQYNTSKNGEPGRFYYHHDPKKHGRGSCTQFDQFPTDIDNPEDLREMCSGVILKPVESIVNPRGETLANEAETASRLNSVSNPKEKKGTGYDLGDW